MRDYESLEDAKNTQKRVAYDFPKGNFLDGNFIFTHSRDKIKCCFHFQLSTSGHFGRLLSQSLDTFYDAEDTYLFFKRPK